MPFRIGDTVKVIARDFRTGQIGTVVNISDAGRPGVKFTDSNAPYYFSDFELQYAPELAGLLIDPDPDVERCDCTNPIDADENYEHPITGESVCAYCYEEVIEAHTCRYCGDLALDSTSDYGYCDSCEERRQDVQDEQERRERTIQDYSFKPAPFFDGLSFEPVPGTPYLGLELEISVDDRYEAAEYIVDTNPTLLYAKDDSSVSGFELVTHPMTLETAKTALPFSELRDLRNDYGASAYDNGIHVHVSRDGFDNDSHVYQWMKLIYRNQADVTRHARRDPSEWAAFREVDEQALDVTAKKQLDSYGTGNRYSAVNVLNSATFEVRVFRGSLRKDEILAALELVAASVEYTRTLTVNNRGEAAWEWAKFIAWAAEQGDTYANLVALDAKTLSEPAPEQVQFAPRACVCTDCAFERRVEYEAELELTGDPF